MHILCRVKFARGKGHIERKAVDVTNPGNLVAIAQKYGSGNTDVAPSFQE